MTTKEYLVKGMHCTHCLQTVETAAKTVSGVQSVALSLESGLMTLEVEDTYDEDLLIETIGEEGFAVQPK